LDPRQERTCSTLSKDSWEARCLIKTLEFCEIGNWVLGGKLLPGVGLEGRCLGREESGSIRSRHLKEGVSQKLQSPGLCKTFVHRQ